MEIPSIHPKQKRQKVTGSFIGSFISEVISVGGFFMQYSILIYAFPKNQTDFKNL